MKLLLRLSVGLMATTIILLGIIMGGLRLGFANIDFFKSEITYVLSEQGFPGVVFSEVRADWNYFNPVLEIRNVSINLPNRSQPLFVDDLKVEFDFWASLTSQTPVVREIAGKIEKLELSRDESGLWWMDEYQLSSDSGTVALPGFIQTLKLIPRYLKLDLRRLIINDRASRNTYQLDRVAAHIKHQQGRFFVQLSAALPETLGQGVVIKAVLNPDRSLVYINSLNVKLARIARLLGIDTREFKTGVIDGEIWIDLEGQRVRTVNGKLVLSKAVLQLADDQSPITIDYQSQFSAVNKTDYWRINNSVGMLKINDFSLRGFHSQVQISDWEKSKVLTAWVNRFELANLPILGEIVLPAGASEILTRSQPQGRFEDVLVSVDFTQLDKIRLSARAVDVSSKAAGSFPGIENLNGQIRSSGNKFGLEMSGSKMRLDFGDQFRAPIELKNFELSAIANYQPAGLILSITNISGTNDDIKISGRMWLESEPGQAPFMHLRAHYSDARGSSAAKYLPVKLLPAKTLQWLDRGIVNGFVPGGELLYHGRLQSIRQLSDRRSGEFYAGFQIEDADIFFAPGWLHARNGYGKVVFHNAAMRIDLNRVSYDQMDNIRAQVSIADIGKNSVLDVAIQADTSTERAFQTWIDTPVGERYRDVVSRLQGLKGQVSSNINIQIPLTRGGARQKVEVRLELDNAGAYVDDWGVELSAVKGIVNVTNEGVFASQVKARYFGDPLMINIATDNESGETLVFADGLLESNMVLNRLPTEISGNISGKSDWKIRLAIARGIEDDQPFLQLNAASNLKDTRIELPEPFARDSREQSNFSAAVNFFKDRIGFKASLAPEIRFAGVLVANDDDNYQPETIDIAFSTGLRPGSVKGLNLYGKIPYLSLPEWFEVIESSGIESPELLNSVDLAIDGVFAFDRDLGKLEVVIDQIDDGFTGNLTSPVVAGNFRIPRERSAENPVTAELEYLLISREGSENEDSRLLPGDLFDIRLSSRRLVYNAMEFEDVFIGARVQEQTFFIDTLQLRHQGVYLAASSRWDYTPENDRHFTSVEVALEGEQFGQTMSALGFGDSIDDGEIDFNGQFSWSGPLPDPNWRSLAGKANLELSQGILNNVDPGGGRLVGLLSLSAIPRRLSLDFDDVLVEGMEFDKISGTYRINAGVLETENTVMDGTAAKIRIVGKTALAQRTYDQQMFVTPKIRHSLPVLGAVAAGTTVGWSLLLLQNLFKDVIDKAIEIEYRITGSWDDPKIELVRAKDENNKVYQRIDK